MLENILSGLFLALVSALTYLAYQHPRVYKSVASEIDSVAWTIATGFIGYLFGFTKARDLLAPIIGDYAKVNAATKAIIPDSIVPLSAFVLGMGYLAILKHFVTRLKDEGENGK